MTGEKWVFAVALGIVLLFAVSAHAYTPEFYYRAEINASYNSQEVVGAAKELGYVIRIETEPLVCRDENWTLDKSGSCKGGIPVSGPVYEYINTHNSTSMSNSDKKFYANSNSGVIYNEHNERFNLDIRTKFPSTDIWTISITPKTINFNLEESKSITLSELKQLKIIEEDVSLSFEELPYSYSVLHSDGQSNALENSYQYIIIVFLVIIVIVITIIYKRG